MKINIYSDKGTAVHGSKDFKWGKENRSKELYEAIAYAENRDELGREGFLIFPSDAFKSFPRASGYDRCKYPHHVVDKVNKCMVLSIAGVKAAYSRAKQQDVFTGEIKEHLIRHYKELGLYENSTMNIDEKVEENFNFIESYLYENFEDEHGISEKSPRHKRRKIYSPFKDESIELLELDEPLFVGESLLNDLNENSSIFEFTNNKLNEFFKSIITPEELSTWMKKEIKYGYVDSMNQSHIIKGNADLNNEDFVKSFKLQSPEELFFNRVGICWDQTEFMREWFNKNYEGTCRIIHIVSDEIKAHPTHTFLLYKDKESYHWFENSWDEHAGIHKYNSWNEAILDVILKIKEYYKLNEDNMISVFDLKDRPKFGISVEEYMEWVKKESKINISLPIEETIREDFNVSKKEIKLVVNDPDDQIEKLLDDIKRIVGGGHSFPIELDPKDSTHQTTYFIDGDGATYIRNMEVKEILEKKFNDRILERVYSEEEEVKEEKEFVPVYGIVKSSLSTSPFGRLVNKATRGDIYQHALISLDDKFSHMYSFVDDGLEDIDLFKHPVYAETDSIYFTVMFISPEEKANIQKYLDYLKSIKDKTSYAEENLYKIFFGKSTKTDKRMICSGLVAYLLGKSNHKNLHRDYSKIRPEDITVLPRAFFVMKVKDNKEFKKKLNEFHNRVNKIYNDNYDEINEYNNHLPKLLLKEVFRDSNTFDKIYSWIVSKLWKDD